LDPNPFPGLTVSPIHGVVPVGGVGELKVHLTPNAVMKFDTRINISIRGWKTLELRMGGTVEPPCVDIDLVSVMKYSENIYESFILTWFSICDVHVFICAITLTYIIFVNTCK
jgi:hypothetical protein